MKPIPLVHHKTHRRTFVKGLATVMAAQTAPLIANSVDSDKKKLGLAIVGLGGYATGCIAPEVSACSHVRLAGVITGSSEKGSEWAKQYAFPEDAIYGYDQIDKLAADDRIDIVHIALPNSMHAEYAIKCAKAGKHVMVEKPMAISSEECEAMIAAAKEAGVLLGVNYRLHWEPHHVKATEIIGEGKLGNLSSGNYEFSWGYARGLQGPNKDKIKKWLLDPKMAGGGALFDTGVYPIQAACYLTGQTPIAVRGMASKVHPELFPDGVEETMSYELQFEGGFQALCRASYSHIYHQCSTMGERGIVEIKGAPRSPRGWGSAFTQSNGKPNPKALFHGYTKIELEQTLQQSVLLDEFAKAIKKGAKIFKTPGEMGLRDVKIIEKIYQSAENVGKLISLT
ncbi:Gfo/Idh/MocA family oxidoreductase [bacterium]|nr:Gfo/Idh/MocA family oxidoreductase [bacterium]